MSRSGNFRGDNGQTDGQTDRLLYPCTCAWGNNTLDMDHCVYLPLLTTSRPAVTVICVNTSLTISQRTNFSLVSRTIPSVCNTAKQHREWAWDLGVMYAHSTTGEGTCAFDNTKYTGYGSLCVPPTPNHFQVRGNSHMCAHHLINNSLVLTSSLRACMYMHSNC